MALGKRGLRVADERAWARHGGRAGSMRSFGPGMDIDDACEISLIVDEKWAARVSLCARALGQSQTEYIVRIVSKSLKANLAAALDALKAEAEVE